MKNIKYDLLKKKYSKNLTPLVSILIPVYNAEKYLAQCLDSCIKQTYKNLEIVCINDGSTDSSLEILNKYALSDKRIRIFSQQNLGIAKAYENAVKNATGEWIYLLDNDDWLKLEALEQLVDISNRINTDYIYCKYQTRYIESTEEYVKSEYPIVFKHRGKGFTSFKNYVSPYKFFKKELYNNVVFPEHLCELQDSCLSWQIISNAQNPILVDLNIYFYRVRNDSVSHKSKDWAMVYDSFEKATVAVCEFLRNSNKWEKQKWFVYHWKIVKYKEFCRNEQAQDLQKQIFYVFQKFLNETTDNVRFLFSHQEQYYLHKYLSFENYKEYLSIPKYNVFKRIFFVFLKLIKLKLIFSIIK